MNIPSLNKDWRESSYSPPVGIVVLATFSVVVLSAHQAEAFGVFDGLIGKQFALPFEEGTTFGSSINDYFQSTASAVLGSSLMKAGFALALLLAVLRFGLGDKTKGLKDFGQYIFILVLLIGPIFQGKSLLIWAADAIDNLFFKVVWSRPFGGLDPANAGGTVGALMSIEQAKLEASKSYAKDLAAFKSECYNAASSAYFKDRHVAPEGGASNAALDPYYKNIVVSPENLPNDMYIYNYSGGSGLLDYTCADFRDYLKSELYKKYYSAMEDYEADLNESGVKLTSDQQALINNAKRTSADSLMDQAVADSPTLGEYEKSQSEKPGLWGTFKRTLKSFAHDPGRAVVNTLMVLARVVVAEIGLVWLWVFDYYVFEFVTVIKTMAAIGLIFSVLYYMFFQKPGGIIACLGLWVYGNTFYIIGAIALNNFWNKLKQEGILVSAANFILGLKSASNDALFALAFLGTTSAMLASVLTWKGASMGAAFATRAARPPKLMPPRAPRGGGSSGSTGGASGGGGASRGGGG